LDTSRYKSIFNKMSSKRLTVQGQEDTARRIPVLSKVLSHRSLLPNRLLDVEHQHMMTNNASESASSTTENQTEQHSKPQSSQHGLKITSSSRGSSKPRQAGEASASRRTPTSFGGGFINKAKYDQIMMANAARSSSP